MAHLVADGWDVYQEVTIGGSRADIVALRGRISWIIEVKAVASLSVVFQAARHIGAAHYISIAAPKASFELAKVARWQRVGILRLRLLSPDAESLIVEEEEAAPIHRHIAPARDVRKLVCPEHKTALAAGSPGGRGAWTPWRSTCCNLARYVREHDGCALKDAIAQIKHHYRTSSTAISCLHAQLRDGLVPSVRLGMAERPARLFTQEPAQVRDACTAAGGTVIDMTDAREGTP